MLLVRHDWHVVLITALDAHGSINRWRVDLDASADPNLNMGAHEDRSCVVGKLESRQHEFPLDALMGGRVLDF